ncbi:alkaline phosphatase D family protein [uncultured Thiohalocapsa sp.]|uniref:alkaline phosphatase D family protein n=1 Tax=uncultured Thiohalocapsa sp. TaxID=768990 RepID=UPI0025DDEB04|nr:alkaline phosphatase D family protein [uncultured Thiohalocapsa sp.]
MQAAAPPLPPIIAGPIPRRIGPDRIVLWLALSAPLDLRLCIYRAGDGAPLLAADSPAATATQVRVGTHAFVRLIDLQPPAPLPVDELLEYDLRVTTAHGEQGLADLLPDLCYPGHARPTLVIRSRLTDLVHGSCRKPHFDGPDALLRLDDLIAAAPADALARPALLMMSGDQIYCDDVAGPMLAAIHQVIHRLGLYPERLTGATVVDSDALMASDACYYRRQDLLPHTQANRALQDIFFGGASKPIFTTASAHNHLITLAEVVAMYLLVWSPALWPQIHLHPQRPPRSLPAKLAACYAAECPVIEGFRDGLARVRRALAHLPVYMIFDDHDITDDWNLSRGWEQAAYGHPFSRRIIGNALIGYWLFQGWGNDPQRHGELLDAARRCLPAHDAVTDAPPATVEPAQGATPAPTSVPPLATAPGGHPQPQDRLIDRLLDFDHWHYSLPTSPKLVVLDTRTHRWWSESSLTKPSGLMDWEELSELQQTLMHADAVVMVSAAPVLGVKLIENVQRVFTWFGLALLVDAENWMAHPGAANVMLNIFRHRRTPRHFVILSGDVHYSFVYDAVLRFRSHSPRIWQITASGLKNEFPHTLLGWFDRLNLWLYGTRSPLNWLTRRRRLRLRARRPNGNRRRRLYNVSALGRVRLDASGTPVDIRLLTADGGEVDFPAPPRAGRHPLR